MDIQILQHDFQLLKEKAIFWKQAKTLILSDIHLGKAEFFNRGACRLPLPCTMKIFDELKNLVLETRAERMILLGDVFTPIKAMPSWNKSFRAASRHLKIRWIFISGNHDKKKLNELSQTYSEWIDQHDVLMEEPFVFIHDHDEEQPVPERTPRFYFSGHIHPVIKLSGGQYNLRVPCFWRRENSMVSSLIRNFDRWFTRLRPTKPDELFAVTDRSVLKVSS